MYDFVIQIATVASLGVIVYLFARVLPRISDDAAEPATGAFDRLITKLPLEKVDTAINSFFEKFLRKTKIFILKIDNLVNGYLNRLKQHAEQKQKQEAHLKEKMEQMVNGMKKEDEDSPKP